MQQRYLTSTSLFLVEDEEEGHIVQGNELATIGVETPRTPRGSLVRNARAQAELKFSYVVTAQLYGKLKNSVISAQQEKAADILYLMQKCVFFSFCTLLVVC